MEILVVILIILILVAVALPSFAGQESKADDSAVTQYLAVTNKSLKQASVEHQGELPSLDDIRSIATSDQDQLRFVSVLQDIEDNQGKVFLDRSNASSAYAIVKSKSGSYFCSITLDGGKTIATTKESSRDTCLANYPAVSASVDYTYPAPECTDGVDNASITEPFAAQHKNNLDKICNVQANYFAKHGRYISSWEGMFAADASLRSIANQTEVYDYSLDTSENPSVVAANDYLLVLSETNQASGIVVYIYNQDTNPQATSVPDGWASLRVGTNAQYIEKMCNYRQGSAWVAKPEAACPANNMWKLTEPLVARTPPEGYQDNPFATVSKSGINRLLSAANKYYQDTDKGNGTNYPTNVQDLIPYDASIVNDLGGQEKFYVRDVNATAPHPDTIAEGQYLIVYSNVYKYYRVAVYSQLIDWDKTIAGSDQSVATDNTEFYASYIYMGAPGQGQCGFVESYTHSYAGNLPGCSAEKQWAVEID